MVFKETITKGETPQSGYFPHKINPLWILPLEKHTRGPKCAGLLVTTIALPFENPPPHARPPHAGPYIKEAIKTQGAFPLNC